MTEGSEVTGESPVRANRRDPDPPGATRVAVDIGNSSLHVRLRSGQGAESATFRTADGGASQAARWIRDRQPDQVRIASVCRPAEQCLIDAIGRDRSAVDLRVIAHGDVPMPTRVDSVEKLGIDRLIAAWAAHHGRSGPVAVIDSGSAITFDLVDPEGVYCGGVILPGLAMQASVLAGGTDRLFEIEFSSHDIHLPATNTADAIHAGILSSVVAGVERIAERYRAQVVEPLAEAQRSLEAQRSAAAGSFGGAGSGARAETLRVVGTGGDVAWLVPLLDMDIELRPDLVCDGILNLPLE